MEQNTKNNTKKAALIATIVILVGALLAAVCLLFTVKSRIIGSWLGGPVYLKAYGPDCNTVLVLEENGDFTDMLIDGDGNFVNIEYGVWEVSGFQISTHKTNTQSVGKWYYNPITNKISGGYWTLKKVE